MLKPVYVVAVSVLFEHKRGARNSAVVDTHAESVRADGVGRVVVKIGHIGWVFAPAEALVVPGTINYILSISIIVYELILSVSHGEHIVGRLLAGIVLLPLCNIDTPCDNHVVIDRHRIKVDVGIVRLVPSKASVNEARGAKLRGAAGNLCVVA